MQITEPIELKGIFWLLDYFQEGRGLQGQLHINTSGRPRLTLECPHDHPARDHYSRDSICHIWGHLFHPYPLILLDECILSDIRPNVTQPAAEWVLDASAACWLDVSTGFLHQLDIDYAAKPAFSGFVCKIAGLTSWLEGVSGFCSKEIVEGMRSLWRNKPLTVHYQRPNDIKLTFPNEKPTITIKMASEIDFDRYAGTLWLCDAPQVQVEFSYPIALDDLKKYLHVVRDFLDIGTGYPVFVTAIHAQVHASWIANADWKILSADWLASHGISVADWPAPGVSQKSFSGHVYMPVGYSVDDLPQRYSTSRMPFSYCTVKDCLPHVWRVWYTKHQKLMPALRAYFNSRSQKTVRSSDEFLELAKGLEALHKVLRCQHTPRCTKKSGEDKFSFPIRCLLTDVCSSLQEAQDFANRIKNARVGLAHAIQEISPPTRSEMAALRPICLAAFNHRLLVMLKLDPQRAIKRFLHNTI